MEKKAAVICGTASLLGLLAVILGFVGEGTKSQVITVTILYCFSFLGSVRNADYGQGSHGSALIHGSRLVDSTG
jgi:hypothetical protein